MGFTRDHLKVFESVVRPNSIAMMNVHVCGDRTVGVFPDYAMLAYLFPVHGDQFVARKERSCSFTPPPLYCRVTVPPPSQVVLFTPTAREPSFRASAARN